MTRQEAERRARECVKEWFTAHPAAWMLSTQTGKHMVDLIAAALLAAADEEREAAAKIAEGESSICGCPHVVVVDDYDQMHYEECDQGQRNDIARAIRARGK